METAYYPVFLQLNSKLCVVIGGGEVAARKAASLLECGAAVRVVSPELHPELEAAAQAGIIEALRRPFDEETLAGAFLVIAAANAPEVNRRAAAYCHARGILCNIVDAPELCSFIVPASVRRGPLTIAVSTGGSAPAVARRIRRRLEEEYDEAYGEVLIALRDARARILSDIADPKLRRRIFTALAEDDLLSVARAGGLTALEQRILELIRAESSH